MQSMVRAAFAAPFESLVLPQGEAAVLIGLRGPECELILTRRADHLNSHAGEVAFPGGRVDPQDASLAITALRETHEEVGVPPSAIELIGLLPSRESRFGVNVIPFVGFVAQDALLTPNPSELAAIFQVPLQFFQDTTPQLAHRVKYQQQEYLMPCFYWQDQVIWGLTAHLVVEFVTQVFGGDVVWPAPRLLG